jgi:hypothetical protein
MATSYASSYRGIYRTTRSVSRTDLVGLSSVSFIRPQRVSFSVTGTKPNTILYPFFDGKSVLAHVAQTGKAKGAPIISDSMGSVTGYFDIPPVTFNTGKRIFLLQDDPNYTTSTIAGNSVGSASAEYTASGILKTFQQTMDVTSVAINMVEEVQTTTVTNNIIAAPPPSPPRPAGVDPLAQTFFTYGVKGGCFITSIAVFFQGKDPFLPITLEIRNTNNGYPANQLVSEYSSKTLNPVSVFTSSNSSLETKFTFDRPIYLQENQEYCFVLLANSNRYNVWTSEFGKISVETGKTIFEQPYAGTLFKSENNSTWTAEQAEDVKFTIYKAQFSAVSGEYTFKANAPTLLIPGYNFSTTSGPNPTITAAFSNQHGHANGDKIILGTLTNATYRGMTAAALGNTAGFSIVVVDEYSFTFTASGCTSTSAGILAASGMLNEVTVMNSGTGYTANPTITISGGGATVQGTAHAQVVAGQVISIIIDTPGSGYTSKPSVLITDASGVGCVLDAVSEAIFVVSMNRQYQNLMPILDAFTPPSTAIACTTKSMSANYTQGEHELTPIDSPRQLSKNAVILNTGTESVVSSGVNSTEFKMLLTTENTNLSPMIDISNKPRLRIHNFIVNGSSNSASEISATTGTSQSKYISKIVKVETPSRAVKVIVSAASIKQTSFDVFVRTSLGSTVHSVLDWTLMTCNVTRDASSTWTEFKDYEFYIDNLPVFDTYDIKIVLFSDVKYLFPKIDNYRVIILAS